MHSNRYTAAPERKHRNLPRVLAATAAMLCIAALLLVLSVVQSHTAAAVRNRDGFRLRSGENVFYSAAGNGLAAATTTGRAALQRQREMRRKRRLCNDGADVRRRDAARRILGRGAKRHPRAVSGRFGR